MTTGTCRAVADVTQVKAVEVRAELRQIRTMADGTVNVILNLPEFCMPQVKVMMDWLKMEVQGVITLADVSEKSGDRYGL